MVYEPRLALSSEVQVLKATVELTDAQIKLLPTAGPEILPAPGAGKMIFLQSALVVADVQAGPYVSDDFLGARLGLYVEEQVTNFLYDGDVESLLTDDSVIGACWFTPKTKIDGTATATWAPVDIATMENQPLKLIGSNASGNFTGGNAANTLKVTVLYMIVDV